jgi:hypothetical protein
MANFPERMRDRFSNGSLDFSADELLEKSKWWNDLNAKKQSLKNDYIASFNGDFNEYLRHPADDGFRDSEGGGGGEVGTPDESDINGDDDDDDGVKELRKNVEFHPAHDDLDIETSFDQSWIEWAHIREKRASSVSVSEVDDARMSSSSFIHSARGYRVRASTVSDTDALLSRTTHSGGGPPKPEASSHEGVPPPPRRLKCGFLTKQGDMVKSWRRRYFVLTDWTLQYFQSKESRSPKGVINLDDVGEVKVLHDPTPRDHGFVLSVFSVSKMRKRNFFLCAEDNVDLCAWVEAVQSTVVRNARYCGRLSLEVSVIVQKDKKSELEKSLWVVPNNCSALKKDEFTSKYPIFDPPSIGSVRVSKGSSSATSINVEEDVDGKVAFEAFETSKDHPNEASPRTPHQRAKSLKDFMSDFSPNQVGKKLSEMSRNAKTTCNSSMKNEFLSEREQTLLLLSKAIDDLEPSPGSFGDSYTTITKGKQHVLGVGAASIVRLVLDKTTNTEASPIIFFSSVCYAIAKFEK